MALTRACGAMRTFFYSKVQEPQESSSVKVDSSFASLDDFNLIESKVFP